MIQRHQPETSARRGPQTAAWGQPGISNEGMIFATGIENSNPTIDNGRVRIGRHLPMETVCLTVPTAFPE